ncbi:MAG: DUF4097 domain-containing protein [bacterium]
MKIMKLITTIGILLLFCMQITFAQDYEADSLTVPFSEPSQPKHLKASVMMGSIFVKGYDGKDAIIVARTRIRKSRENRMKDGMRLIPNTSTGLTVEEEDNEMSISTSSWARAIELTIKVPRWTSLELSSMNGGVIEVDKIEGEVEANNMNGSVALTNISGAAIAYSANGRVTVAFDNITPDKTMSFITMNGTIDVTFPTAIKADVKLRTDNGNVYSDFDIEMQRNVRKIEKSPRGKGRKYRVTLDKDMYGTINGGGPEFQFRTLNGNIYIRKKK